MATIELVIKIDEEDYKIMQHNIAVDNPLCPLGEKEMVSKVANGMPLPKGHGRLGDLDALEVLMKDEIIRHDLNEYGCFGLVNRALTIIEADKDIKKEN